MSLHLGIDYGGTSTKLILGSPEPGHTPTPVAEELIDSPRGEHALAELARAAGEFLGSRRIETAGISVPGLIGADGLVRAAVNLPWLVGHHLAEEAGDLLGAPVQVLNDGHAAAYAEAVLGAGRDYEDSFIVALGTGIASKHVIGGHVRTGAHQGAGEIGHIVCDPGGRLCSCGQRGCLETLIGGSHLARRWQEVVDGSSVAPEARVTAEDLARAARQGDPRARVIADSAAEGLATVLLGVIATIDPGVIVIGGGIAQAREEFVSPAIEAIARRATFHHVPQILPAGLGPWAGAWGAALGARDLQVTDPSAGESGTSEPGTAAPSTGAPGAATSGTSTPGTGEPHQARPTEADRIAQAASSSSSVRFAADPPT